MTVTKAKTTSEFEKFIVPEQAKAIFEEARRHSVVQSLAKKVPLSGEGKAFPVITNHATAKWTGEAEEGHKSQVDLGMKIMKPHKLTTTFVVSEEVMAADPAGYADILYQEAAESFGRAFDLAALYGKGMTGGSAPFDTHLAQTSKSVELGTSPNGIYADLVAGLELLKKAKKHPNGFVFDDATETLFLDALDANKRPIFALDNLQDGLNPLVSGRLIGRKFTMGTELTDESTHTVGFLGDWTKAAWGVVGGIRYRLSREAAVTINGKMVSAFDDDLVLVKASAYYGWLCADTDAFVKYTNAS